MEFINFKKEYFSYNENAGFHYSKDKVECRDIKVYIPRKSNADFV